MSYDKIVIYLPTMPPTVNTAYTTVRGRRVLSKVQREFRKQVAAIVKHPMPDNWKFVDVEIILTPQKRMRFDVDNRIKPLQDALTGCLWKDDSQVASVRALCTEPSEGGGTIIIVKKAAKKYLDPRTVAPILSNAIVFKQGMRWVT